MLLTQQLTRFSHSWWSLWKADVCIYNFIFLNITNILFSLNLLIFNIFTVKRTLFMIENNVCFEGFSHCLMLLLSLYCIFWNKCFQCTVFLKSIDAEDCQDLLTMLQIRCLHLTIFHQQLFDKTEKEEKVYKKANLYSGLPFTSPKPS